MSYFRELMRGQDNTCNNSLGRYAQRLELVNKSNVKELRRASNGGFILGLRDNSRRVYFGGPDRGSDIAAWVNKRERGGMPVYQHNVSLPIWGVGVEAKAILEGLDNAEYFAIVKWLGLGGVEVIEAYGYGNGLNTGEYEYNPAKYGWWGRCYVV